MPELPEVETIRLGLSRLLVGKTVRSVHNYTSPKSFPNTKDDTQQFLIGATVEEVRRRAKVLLIELSTDYTLMVHLKMTGQLVYIQEGPTPPLGSKVNSEPSLHPLKLARGARSVVGSPVSDTNVSDPVQTVSSLSSKIQDLPSARWGGGHPSDSLIRALPDNTTREHIDFTDGSRLYFNDLRKFGWMKLLPTVMVPEQPFMLRVGPEPLEDSFTADTFIPRIRRRNNTTIKAAILDQTVLAGVGNIYADESLWAAKLHPASRVRDVTDEQLTVLLDEIKKVMKLSIEKGGSTDKNYVDAEGKKGSYLKFANVFRLEGHPCPRCGSTIEKIRVAGRGTHLCPQCQVLQ